MGRFTGTVWAPLTEAGAPDGYEKTQFIVHSTGDNGTAAATRRYFEGPTPNESTVIVGWGPEDPTLQIMDSSDLADANLSASQRGISVEVVGDGNSGYNAWQRSELVRIGIEARQLHPGILPRIIPTHTEPGYGWHVMFGAPGPWARGAKSCPGGIRIQELKDDIFPAIFAGNQEDDDMKPILANDGTGKVWIGNFITRRHVADEAELKGLQFWFAEEGLNPTVRTIKDIRVLGVDVTSLARREDVGYARDQVAGWLGADPKTVTPNSKVLAAATAQPDQPK